MTSAQGHRLFGTAWQSCKEGLMASTNKCLAESNKSPHRANATKKRTRRPSTGARQSGRRSDKVQNGKLPVVTTVSRPYPGVKTLVSVIGGRTFTAGGEAPLTCAV